MGDISDLEVAGSMQEWLTGEEKVEADELQVQLEQAQKAKESREMASREAIDKEARDRVGGVPAPKSQCHVEGQGALKGAGHSVVH